MSKKQKELHHLTLQRFGQKEYYILECIGLHTIPVYLCDNAVIPTDILSTTTNINQAKWFNTAVSAYIARLKQPVATGYDIEVVKLIIE